MARKFDWSTFKLGIIINVSPRKVYRIWATAAGLAIWFPNAVHYEHDLSDEYEVGA